MTAFTVDQSQVEECEKLIRGVLANEAIDLDTRIVGIAISLAAERAARKRAEARITQLQDTVDSLVEQLPRLTDEELGDDREPIQPGDYRYYDPANGVTS